MKKFTLAVLGIGMLTFAAQSSLYAIPPFKKAFAKKYTDKEKDLDYFNLVKKTGCDVCHVKKQKKNIHNDYGKQLNALIDGHAAERLKEAGAKSPEAKKEETEKLLAELDAAFEKVAKMENKAKETWGARIEAGKLPVPVAEAQETAKKEAESDSESS